MNLKRRIAKLEAVPVPASEGQVDALLADVERAAHLDPETGLAAVLEKHPKEKPEKDTVRFLLAVAARRQARADSPVQTT
ncbi:hypothetical protein [Gemmata sp.]|uniref:hypothetical protein n=1 Tax=Gemmata sp. TaxID=1914242 RepID=UPI003F6F89E8